jgi:hypothetical protein
MARIDARRVFSDSDKDNKKSAVPDIIKILNVNAAVGDEIIMPVNLRGGDAVFWEFGGRNKSVAASIGTIISGYNDNILNATLFNKTNRKPNGRHAMIKIKPDYHLYVGRINVKRGVLAPTIRIIRMTYNGVDEITTPEPQGKHVFGKFTVTDIYTEYSAIQGCIPAERLVDKLFASNVMRPFFANGWSITNISRKPSDRESITASYNRILQDESPVEIHTHANQFIDAVENCLVEINNPNLSSVLQYINFNTGQLSIKPLRNLYLGDIEKTINDAKVEKTFSIPIENMKDCYNPALLFHAEDIPMLEMALANEDRYVVKTGEREYIILRAWRG